MNCPTMIYASDRLDWLYAFPGIVALGHPPFYGCWSILILQAEITKNTLGGRDNSIFFVREISGNAALNVLHAELFVYIFYSFIDEKYLYWWEIDITQIGLYYDEHQLITFHKLFHKVWWDLIRFLISLKPYKHITLTAFLPLRPPRYLIGIFTLLKLCLGDARHNFKCVTILHIWPHGGQLFRNRADWCHVLNLTFKVRTTYWKKYRIYNYI